MSARHIESALLHRDEIVEAPPARACTDQSFELPTGIYVAMGLMFVGFVGVLGFAFRTEMALSYGVIFAFLAAFFAVPSLFPRVAGGESRSKSLEWSEFRQKGIATATGRATSGEATILVLLLPFLILCFAIAVATIAAIA